MLGAAGFSWLRREPLPPLLLAVLILRPHKLHIVFTVRALQIASRVFWPLLAAVAGDYVALAAFRCCCFKLLLLLLILAPPAATPRDPRPRIGHRGSRCSAACLHGTAIGGNYAGTRGGERCKLPSKPLVVLLRQEGARRRLKQRQDVCHMHACRQHRSTQASAWRHSEPRATAWPWQHVPPASHSRSCCRRHCRAYAFACAAAAGRTPWSSLWRLRGGAQRAREVVCYQGYVSLLHQCLQLPLDPGRHLGAGGQHGRDGSGSETPQLAGIWLCGVNGTPATVRHS